jgi:plastocyanin
MPLRAQTSPLFAAMLPASRSVQVGQTATAFATIINGSSAAKTNCGIAPTTSVPATFSFQTTDPHTNGLTGTPNTGATIAAGGAQSYLIAFVANAPLPPTDVLFNYSCDGTASAEPIVGLNTLLLTFDTNPVPDMIAVGLTPSNDGFARTGGPGGTGLLVIASDNIGSSATLTARARLSDPTLPITATVCQTNPSTAACFSPPAASVTAIVNNNDTPTWAAFLTASGAITADPANKRAFFEFLDGNGVIRGSTSTAVTTGASAAVSVSMLDFSFSPVRVSVAQSGTTTWTNAGGANHTVTADDGSFDSGTLSSGQTFSRTYTTLGTFPYHCRFHGSSGGVGMSGVITVTQ